MDRVCTARLANVPVGLPPWRTTCRRERRSPTLTIEMLVEPQEYLFHREDEHSRCLLAIKVPVDQPTNSPFLVPHPLTLSPRPLPNMQDPKKEIPNIIQTLCTTRDVNELEATVLRRGRRVFPPTVQGQLPERDSWPVNTNGQRQPASGYRFVRQSRNLSSLILRCCVDSPEEKIKVP